MTEEEIRRDHRLAKDPDAQVQVLAQINGVKPKVIQRILAGQSIEEATVREPPRYSYIPKGTVKHWTAEDKKVLRQMWLEGCKAMEIAAVLGRSVQAVRSAAKLNKLPPRWERKKKTAHDVSAS